MEKAYLDDKEKRLDLCIIECQELLSNILSYIRASEFHTSGEAYRMSAWLDSVEVVKKAIDRHHGRIKELISVINAT